MENNDKGGRGACGKIMRSNNKRKIKKGRMQENIDRK